MRLALAVVVAALCAACAPQCGGAPPPRAPAPCGASGEPCCTGGGGTPFCTAAGVRCQQGGCGPGTCVRCGVEGAQCCPGAQCSDVELVCNESASSLTCTYTPPVCVHCGAAGEPCCALGRCARGAICRSEGRFAASRCVACGGAGQPCCAEQRCASEYACVAGECRGGSPVTLPDGAVVERLFARCTDDAACGASPGARCLTTYPGGLCTRRCAEDSECGRAGACAAGVCLPRCAPGRALGECSAVEGECSAYGVCVPSCFPEGSEPATVRRCNAGTACDPYTGACASAPRADAGRPNGAPCASSADCAGGACLLAQTEDPAQPTGYLGGYCVSFARRPAASDYAAGVALPRSNCPEGSVVPPRPRPGDGDRAACFRACVADCECRPGYYCDHLSAEEGGPFSDGVCMPVDCADPARPCPAGARCAVSGIDASARRGVCGAIPGSDAGAGEGDAGACTPDAAGDDAAGADAARGDVDAGGMDAGIDS